MKVILFQPDIPQNCGNIVRTCSVTGCSLVLVRPLGFSLSDRLLKRAGLDYWEGVEVEIIDDLPQYLNEKGKEQAAFFSSKANKCYTDMRYRPETLLVFGSETQGLPQSLHNQYASQFVCLPMQAGKRCLNLATSVGIVVYEAWRQQGFLRS